jgi:hypothetical protein
MSILTDYLQKIGVKSVDELNSEEKSTYAEWEKTLSGRQLTEADVRTFLDQEVEQAIKSLTTKSLGERDDLFLKMKIEFTQSLCSFLDSPTKEKEMIASIINNKN